MRAMRVWVAAAALAACSGAAAYADLKSAMAEPDLGKRSKLALDNASAALKAAREAYNKGESEKVTELVQEFVDSVNLASDSLRATGKNPRRSPKWFKQAELSTRDLLKRIETFQHDMAFEERNSLDKAKARTQEVHDELLLGLMEGKKK